MKPFLKDIPYIDKISEVLAPGQEAYVVGGTVRDLALGRTTGDIDIAVTGDSGALAARIAVSLGGSPFCMDEGRDVYRVMVAGGQPAQVDITPLKGDIHVDLAARDFSINAMAIPMMGKSPPSPPFVKGGMGGFRSHTGVSPGKLEAESGGAGVGGMGGFLDPFGGMADLRAGIVRALDRDSFTADPLRLIRAFRIARQLGFSIERDTLSYIRQLAPEIGKVSAERVRDELYIILEGEGSSGVFREMSDAGLLAAVIPEAGAMYGVPQSEPHVYDLMEHSLKAMEYAERVMAEPGRYFGVRAVEVGETLGEKADGGLSMAGLAKLAAFLHDVGKPSCMKRETERIRFTGHDEEGGRIAQGIAERLKMSARAAGCLSLTARWHMRPLHMSKYGCTRHAVYRYVRDMGESLPVSLVLAMADTLATRDRPDAVATDVEGVVKSVVEYYYGEYARAKAEPLLRGRDLIDALGLTPGPAFSRILEDVEEKRAEGEITTREEAERYVKENLGRFNL